MSSETVPPTAKDDGENATNATEPESSAITQPDANKSVSDQRKKRRSDVQINKDDHPEGDGSDDDGDLNDEGEKRSDPFKRASVDVLKKRKIVKASIKWGGGGTASSGGGAFASVKLTASNKTVPSFGNTSSSASKKGGFGSGFGAVSQGFGAVTASSAPMTGFGSTSVVNNNGFKGKSEEKDKSSNTTETKPSVFGGGFGAVSSGFRAVKSGSVSVSSAAASSVFGSTVTNTVKSTNDDNDAKEKDDQDKSGDVSSPKKDSSDEKAKYAATDAGQSYLFPTTTIVDVNNGEENEECLCQIIAKLYKMVPDVKEPEGIDMEKGDVPSVPSSSGRFGGVKQNNDNNGTAIINEEENANKDEKGVSGSKLVRKEAGVGNVRVLKRRSLGDDDKNENKSLGRVVQRQRGSNTLILNIRLIPKQCKVTRPGEKFVQLNAPSKDGTLESFLFRVKTAEDSQNLVKHLESMLEDVENKA